MTKNDIRLVGPSLNQNLFPFFSQEKFLNCEVCKMGGGSVRWGGSSGGTPTLLMTMTEDNIHGTPDPKPDRSGWVFPRKADPSNGKLVDNRECCQRKKTLAANESTF